MESRENFILRDFLVFYCSNVEHKRWARSVTRIGEGRGDFIILTGKLGPIVARFKDCCFQLVLREVTFSSFSVGQNQCMGSVQVQHREKFV